MQVPKVFMNNLYNLHGLPNTIASDREVFLGIFEKKLL